MTGIFGGAQIGIQHTALVPLHQRQDAPRAEPRLRVRVQLGVPHAAKSVVVAGTLVTAAQADADGCVEIVCYESDFGAVRDLVETELDAIDRAERALALRHATEAAQAMSRPVTDVMRPETWDDRARRAVASSPASVEAEFFRLVGRGIRPLRSAQIVETLPAPSEERTHEIADVIRAALAADRDRSGDSAERLAAALAERLGEVLAKHMAKKG